MLDQDPTAELQPAEVQHTAQVHQQVVGLQIHRVGVDSKGAIGETQCPSDVAG